MKGGFIKLFRQITKHWLWFADPFDRAHAWIDLLLMANWETGMNCINGITFEQQRGEIVVSIGYLAKRWRWSKGKVTRFLDALSGDGMIHTDGRAYGTCITIENYTYFQGGRRANGSADGAADGSADGAQSKKKEEEYKETRARECDQEAVDSAQREDDEELARLLGYESVEELERRRA